MVSIPNRVERTSKGEFLTLLALLFVMPAGTILCLAALYFKFRNYFNKVWHNYNRFFSFRAQSKITVSLYPHVIYFLNSYYFLLLVIMKKLIQKRTSWIIIINIIAFITFFLAEFDYIDPIPFNEAFVWLTLVAWTVSTIYDNKKKKKLD